MEKNLFIYYILARSGAAKPPPFFVFRHAPSRPRDGTDVGVLYILILKKSFII